MATPGFRKTLEWNCPHRARLCAALFITSSYPVCVDFLEIFYDSEFVLAANQSSLFNRRIASGHSQSRADHSTSVAESDNKARSMRMTQTSLTSFEQVGQWLHHGKVSNLEILILEGKSHSIEERDDVRERSRDIHPAARDFIALIPRYKEQVDALLEAIVFGDERTVRETIHYERCILARHPLTLATTVHLAVIHNHPKILQLILSYPHAPLHSKDMEGRTPLHYAAAMAGTFIDSDPKCYDMLMDRNANENIADHEGYTPLNFYRTPTLIDIQQIRGLNQYPVIGGDDIDHMISERNVTALKALILSGDYSKANIEERVYPPASRDLAQFMANLNMRLEAIREAIRDDDFATMKQLLDSTDFATARDEFGRSSLHLAVLHGRERMVRYLLLLFPDCVDALDKGGRSALHYATSLSDGEKRKMMTRLLFRAGAKSSAPSSGLIQTLPEKIEDTARYISQQREFYGPMDTNGIDGKEKRRTRITKAVAESGHISSPSLSPTKTAPNQEYRHQNGQAPTTKQHKHRRGHRHPQSEEKIRRQDSHRRLTRTSTTYDWNSKRKSIAAPHTATHKAMFFQDDDEEDIDAEVEDRLLDIDFDKKEYSGLEQLQFEGKSDEIWKVVKKHLGNEKLYKYLHRYRQAQSRLNSAFAAIDENDLKKLKTLLDEELVQTRDSRGLAVLHLAVLKERHEIVEHIAYSFPKLIDIADHAGRTAAHYAAPQQNAIYDTLLEAGANIYLPDKNGFTASRYRNSPDQMVLPLPPPPTLPVDSQATATVGNFKQRMSIDELNNFDPGIALLFYCYATKYKQ
ncbi:ankyrin repeats (3 copies) domain-containing protein [Ditylenchus destructor]|uniref:Ankyrin repeats (3 copies) domain-containing protein n=1 Tax=Ditylenchus destructor TaxID=166010 RepID=A0AAD4R4E5_9BILA|nr:ankyrin repeats (3 copies) domain-containing protein [Ditylenchus destructor]